MSASFVQKYPQLATEMGNVYLDNMELELGKKYQDNTHEVDASLTGDQYRLLKNKYELDDNEIANLYAEFQQMQSTEHMKRALDAFYNSGGAVDIEPEYDADAKRLKVNLSFSIKDRVFDKIEGLSDMEHIQLRMNAMIQLDGVLAGWGENASPDF